MPQLSSPKNSPCVFCGKKFSTKGVYEHERHACPKNPDRKPRTFGKKRCPYCKRKFHAAGLRSHIATQHPLEFAQHVKKSDKQTNSRAAQRRRLVQDEEEKRIRGREIPNRLQTQSTQPPSASDRFPTKLSTRALRQLQQQLSDVAQPGSIQEQLME